MQDDVPRGPSPRLIGLMTVMLIAGASNVLLKDFMVNVEAPLGHHGRTADFNRPILWSLLMKAGMALCLPFHWSRLHAPLYVFGFSCALGFAVDVLVNSAYCAIAGSAIQMLRGGKILLTALLSMTLLRRRLQQHQLLGGCIVILGISLVGLSTSRNPESQSLDASGLPWKAIGCCIAGEILQAVLWVYQESVLKKYDIPPLQLVGMEGVLGIAVGSVIMIIAHPLGVENVSESFHQLSHSVPLMISVACLLVSMAFFNFSGVGVTKLGSAVHRSIIDVSRAVLIWMVELLLRWHTFIFCQFVGFVVLVVGALIYNNLLFHSPICEDGLKPLLSPEKKQQQA
jgi:drug/metabolite transporter (DMT)-like permease